MTKQIKGRKFFAVSATAALVASAIVPVASAASVNDFSKVSGYAKEAVQSLVDSGVIKGDDKGNFNPTSTVTRAEAAQIFVNALKLESKGSVNFTDVKANAWYHDAISAAVENGIFEGVSATQFAPSKSLTRAEAAKILVEAFDLTGTANLNQFDDASAVKAWAKPYLEIAVANGIFQGSTVNGKTNLNPNASITRQDFAVVFHRTVEANATVDAAVKAINNTTVEVTFENNIDDIKALDFTIEGLEVTNAVIKQTNKKTAVITTSAQTAGTEYTVSVNGDKVGKFKGIAEVIPTKVTTTTASLQGVIGEQVTVKAQVTVAEGQSKAGIPVTFNILNSEKANDKIEVEAFTNEQGEASYSYTRYYGSEDTVTAYATKKSSLYDQAKVYWANEKQLVVTETTTGNELSNNTKKSYKVTGKANSTYYIAIKENLGVNPDKVKKLLVQDSTTGNFVTPKEILDNPNGNTYATVRTNAKGEGAFTVHGENVEGTPIVYAPETTPAGSNATQHDRVKYNRLDLQSQAPTVKFSQVNALQIAVVGEGTADAAEYLNGVPTSQKATSVGGRTYTVTVTTKDGKVAPAGTVVYVTFKDDNYSTLTGDAQYLATGTGDFKKIDKNLGIQELKVGKDGKVQFRVAGKGSTSHVKPTVFADTAGKQNEVKLDTTDVQQDGEITYFKGASVVNATLTVEDEFGRQVTSVPSGKTASFVYQSVDQNGFPYQPVKNQVTGGQEYYKQVKVGEDASGNPIYIWVKETSPVTENPITEDYVLAFDVNSTFGNVIVSGEGVQKPDNTNTYRVKSSNGKAVVNVTTLLSDTVKVNVTGVNNILPTVSASVSFVGSATVPDLFTGYVESYNPAKAELKFRGAYEKVKIDGEKVLYKVGQTNYLTDYAAFINTLRSSTGGVQLTREVKDGVTTFTINNVNVPGVAAPIDETKPTNPNPEVKTLVFTSTEAIAAGDVLVAGVKFGTVAATTTVGEFKITLVEGKAKPTANFEATIGSKVYNFVTTDNGATWSATEKVSEVTGVTLSEITNFVNPTAFGKIAVVIEPAQLPAELKGAETLVLTVKGTAYEAKLENNEYFYSIPAAGLTVEEVKAGKVTKK